MQRINPSKIISKITLINTKRKNLKSKWNKASNMLSIVIILINSVAEHYELTQIEMKANI
ncbi:hypothetical protein GCM10011446_29920 [Acinetobacter vivianii]|nr:hypothetical protein GCM10011446_29920 [Acinetobacter vivianii]